MEGREVGRPCSVCSAVNRSEIEDGIYSGTSISRISKEFQISSSSLYRHIRNHASEVIREHFRATTAMDTASLAQRVLEIADAARSIRIDATNDAIKLKAGQAELQTLLALAARTGVTPENYEGFVKEAQKLAYAVGIIAIQNPEFGETLVDHLSEQGADKLASAVLTRVDAPVSSAE